MKFFNKKNGLSLVIALSSLMGNASAAGEDARLSTDVATSGFPTEVFDVEPASAAQIAQRTGIQLEGGMLSRDLSTALFPALDLDMIKSYAALAKYEVVKVNAGKMQRMLKRWGGRAAMAGALSFFAYKTWFVKEQPVVVIPKATPNPVAIPPVAGGALAALIPPAAAAPQPLTAADLENGLQRLETGLIEYNKDVTGRHWYDRLGHNISSGFGTAVQFGVAAALTWGVTYAFSSDPASPLARYFVDTLNTQSNNLCSSAIEYSTIVETAVADKAQSDDNFMSIVSSSHAHFIKTLEQYFGNLVAIRAHFEKQQEVCKAQLEAMKDKPNVNEVTLAEKRRALKVAKTITDNIDSTLIQAYPLANNFTTSLAKARKRNLMSSVIQGNIARLCNTSQEQMGILTVYGKQLETELYHFYGLEKPKAPDLSALFGNAGALMGMGS